MPPIQRDALDYTFKNIDPQHRGNRMHNGNVSIRPWSEAPGWCADIWSTHSMVYHVSVFSRAFFALPNCRMVVVGLQCG